MLAGSLTGLGGSAHGVEPGLEPVGVIRLASLPFGQMRYLGGCPVGVPHFQVERFSLERSEQALELLVGDTVQF